MSEAFDFNKAHVAELYGLDISNATISVSTDNLILELPLV